MQNTIKANVIFLMIFCSTFALAQKKKKKEIPPPPKTEIVQTDISNKSEADEIEYISPPVALSNENIRTEKPKMVEILNLNSNAKKCACDNSSLFLTDKQLGEGITWKDFALKGNIKSIKNVERRDTLVGYSETLSKGNIVEMTFSYKGFLETHSRDMMDKLSKSQSFKSISQLFYNSENQIITTEIYLADMKNLMAKNRFLYNEMGLYEVETTDKDKKPIQKRTTFDCYKTDNQFFVVKKELYTDRNQETHEMMVFNRKNQLIKKQEISNNDGNTTNNKTKTFGYNNLGCSLKKIF